MSSRADTVYISHKYRGPSQSANGGYCAGVLANCFNGEPTEVNLSAPPPLDKELELIRDSGLVTLMDGQQPLANAKLSELSLEPIPGISVEDAKKASEAYVGFDKHTLPECFVCGTLRAPGDGLRIYPGKAEPAHSVATTWAPSSEFVDNEGNVRNEIVWAALDCPSYFGLQEPGLMALLAKMKAQVYESLSPERTYVVQGWKLSQDGRKYWSAASIRNEQGKLMALSECLWIVLQKNH